MAEDNDRADEVIRPATEPPPDAEYAGWSAPLDEVPHPTYWPTVLALSLTLIGFGFVTSIIISVVGLVLLGLSLGGWIGDLHNAQRREQHQH